MQVTYSDREQVIGCLMDEGQGKHEVGEGTFGGDEYIHLIVVMFSQVYKCSNLSNYTL